MRDDRAVSADFFGESVHSLPDRCEVILLRVRRFDRNKAGNGAAVQRHFNRFAALSDATQDFTGMGFQVANADGSDSGLNETTNIVPFYW
jgi:hypothetical protein